MASFSKSFMRISPIASSRIKGCPSSVTSIFVSSTGGIILRSSDGNIGLTFKKDLAKAGVIFCSFSEAVKDHPELVKKYFGSVVPYTDNYYAALNAAVFSDGSFVYIPKTWYFQKNRNRFLLKNSKTRIIINED